LRIYPPEADDFLRAELAIRPFFIQDGKDMSFDFLRKTFLIRSDKSVQSGFADYSRYLFLT
jgi:hypothetical protein